jgi:hypothetical protein
MTHYGIGVVDAQTLCPHANCYIAKNQKKLRLVGFVRTTLFFGGQLSNQSTLYWARTSLIGICRPKPPYQARRTSPGTILTTT